MGQGGRRWAVTGATGRLGGHVVAQLLARGETVVALGRRLSPEPGADFVPLDLAEPGRAGPALAEARPDVVLHLGGLASVPAAAREPGLARRINVEATREIAAEARAQGARPVFASTDFVFDGTLGRPYREEDAVNPTTTYGRSKAEAEEAVIAAGGVAARLSWLWGPPRPGTGRDDRAEIAARLRAGEVRAVTDERRTPIAPVQAAEAMVALADAPPSGGLIHLGGPERLTAFELFSRLAAEIGAPPPRPMRRVELGGEPRPADVSLNSGRWRRIRAKLFRPAEGAVSQGA